ncbi:uncharacterized protein LOC120889211 [Ictidomys tridecemlineatus]
MVSVSCRCCDKGPQIRRLKASGTHIPVCWRQEWGQAVVGIRSTHPCVLEAGEGSGCGGHQEHTSLCAGGRSGGRLWWASGTHIPVCWRQERGQAVVGIRSTHPCVLEAGEGSGCGGHQEHTSLCAGGRRGVRLWWASGTHIPVCWRQERGQAVVGIRSTHPCVLEAGEGSGCGGHQEHTSLCAGGRRGVRLWWASGAHIPVCWRQERGQAVVGIRSTHPCGLEAGEGSGCGGHQEHTSLCAGGRRGVRLWWASGAHIPVCWRQEWGQAVVGIRNTHPCVLEAGVGSGCGWACSLQGPQEDAPPSWGFLILLASLIPGPSLLCLFLPDRDAVALDKRPPWVSALTLSDHVLEGPVLKSWDGLLVLGQESAGGRLEGKGPF